MNDGLLVAVISVVGSAITVVANTALTMWGKWVDSHQKANEHKYAVRSVYVTKKIEAGQAYIAANVLTANSDLANLSVLRRFCHTGEVPQDLQQAVFDTKQAEQNKILNGDNFAAVFFDFRDFSMRSSTLDDKFQNALAEIQVILKGIKAGQLSLDDTTKQKINELIGLYTEKINLIRDKNDSVRRELAKYDII